MIHPYLAYCNLVWASNYRARLKRLIVLQNRAISVIIGCFNVSCSTDSLYKQLRILKIGQITTLQINEFTYKHYNKLLPPIFSNYFTITSQVNPYNLRSSNNYRLGCLLKIKSGNFNLPPFQVVRFMKKKFCKKFG